MHSNNSGSGANNHNGRFANNCCSSASCGKSIDPYLLRQSTVHFSSQPPPPPPPLSSVPLSPTAVPYDMTSNNSCLHYPSIRTASSSVHSPRAVLYVYELPYNVRKAICDLLDADNSWRELGGRYMGFNDTQLTLISHALYRSASPTNELLTKWESSNAKVAHLYRFLADMKHRRAMYHLLGYVDDKLRMMYEAFNEHSRFDSSTEARFHEQRSGMAPLPMHSGPSMKAHSFKHSTLNDIHHHHDHSPKFFDQQQQQQQQQQTQNNPILNKQTNKLFQNPPSDEERTLIDQNNERINKSTSESDKNNRLNKQKLDYLVRIEDLEIPYKELSIATDDFCKDNILGSGGFGTVYIGEWKGTKVAVKKLKGLDNSSQAFTELRVLNCCRIDNILPLYGVALDGPEPCLVYQYMSNGSLEDRLLCKGGTIPLNWLQRANIGEGIARALNFLHTLKGNPFVHGDVKSANILLDSVFEPKLGDFGLARKVEKRGRNEDSLYTHCTVSSVNGTSVYLPAEYLRNKILSPAVDVYSYGIVILEMATGRRAYDGKRLLINTVEDEYGKVQKVTTQQQPRTDGVGGGEVQSNCAYDSMMDKRIVHLTLDRHWFNCLLELGRKCAHKSKLKRPIMIQVLEYYNQCKTTDRIHKLCGDKKKISCTDAQRIFSKMNLSKSSPVKSPLELQLWYDFVRKSCGTLSDVVFENFGAQVTKMIEECRFSFSNQSNLHLDRLLGQFGQASSEFVPNQHNVAGQLAHQQQVRQRHASQPNESQQAKVSPNQSNNSDDSSLYQNPSINLPQMLEFMTMSSGNSATNSADTMEDELSSWEDSTTSGMIPELSEIGGSLESELDKDEVDGQSATPFIPLLTALGFQSDDIDQVIEDQDQEEQEQATESTVSTESTSSMTNESE